MTEPAKPDRAGQLRRGWNMIARDLDRAFVLALLGTNEAVVLQAVREHSWVKPLKGRKKGEPLPDPIPCKLNFSRLADQTGLSRPRLSVAHANLVRSRILVEIDSGYVHINKEYRSWVYPATASSPERPRFTEAQATFIRDAIEKEPTGKPFVKTVTEAQQSDTSQSVTEAQHCQMFSVTEAQQDCCASVTPTVIEAQQSPVDERARDLRVRELKSAIPPQPPMGEVVGGIPLRSQQQRIVTSSDIDSLCRWCVDTLGDRAESDCVLQNITGWAKSYELWWIETAILCAKAKTDLAIGKTSQYINGCLSQWWPNGPKRSEIGTATETAHHTGGSPSNRYPAEKVSSHRSFNHLPPAAPKYRKNGAN